MRVTLFLVAFVATLIIAAEDKKQNTKEPKIIVHQTENKNIHITTTSYEDKIVFHLVVREIKKGWVGIGVNTREDMENSDMAVLMFSGKNSNFEMRDMYTKVNDVPTAHNTYAWELVNKTITRISDETSGDEYDQTRIFISRPYTSANVEFGAMNIENKPLYIIWAYKPMTLFLKHDSEERGYIKEAVVLNPFYSSGESITGRITFLVFAFVIVQSNSL